MTSDRLAWKRGAVVDSEEFDSYIQVVRLVAGGHLVPLQKASAGSHNALLSRDEPAEDPTGVPAPGSDPSAGENEAQIEPREGGDASWSE